MQGQNFGQDIGQKLGEMVDQRHEMWKEGYEKGLNDAWEVCKKIMLSEEDSGYTYLELQDIFDGDGTFSNIGTKSIQEVMNRVKAYEEKKNKIVRGDVVKCRYANKIVRNGIFLAEYSDHYLVLMREFNVPQRLNKNAYTLTKTGKHVDIGKLFEGIEE